MFDNIFLICMNTSQNTLNPKVYTQVYRAQKTWRKNGMLDLAIQTVAFASLLASPLILIVYVRSRVRHALKTAIKEAQECTAP